MSLENIITTIIIFYIIFVFYKWSKKYVPLESNLSSLEDHGDELILKYKDKNNEEIDKWRSYDDKNQKAGYPSRLKDRYEKRLKGVNSTQEIFRRLSQVYKHKPYRERYELYKDYDDYAEAYKNFFENDFAVGLLDPDTSTSKESWEKLEKSTIYMEEIEKKFKKILS